MSTEGVTTLNVLLIIINTDDDYTVFLEKNTEKFVGKSDEETSNFFRFPYLQYQTKYDILVTDSVYHLHTDICRDIKRIIDIENDSLSISIRVHIKEDSNIYKVNKDNNEAWVVAELSNAFEKIESNSNVKWVQSSDPNEIRKLLSGKSSTSAFMSIFGNKTFSFGINPNS